MTKTGLWMMLTGVIILIYCSGGVAAFPYTNIPGLTGLVTSSTSDPAISSSLSLSTSTHIVSSGASESSPVGSSSGQQTVSVNNEIPQQWQLGVREGIYYDPLSKTSWIFDRILKKYYSPDNGWLLIGEYTTGANPRLLRQYYYDPAEVVFYSIKTGEKISINQNGIYDPATSQTSVTPKPTSKPQQTLSTTILMSPEPAISESSQSGVEDPCLVPCSECQGGTCRDCNQNGICDESEKETPTPTPTGGISETAQSGILFKKDI